MEIKQYFPQGLAEGRAFLGRQTEVKRLIENIKIGAHTLLLAPRRFGKTSLAKHAIKQARFPYTEIDLFLAIDEKAVETRLLDGVESLLEHFSNKTEHWAQALIHFFKTCHTKWTVGFKGIKLELKPETHDDISKNILDALNALEHILSLHHQRAVIFMDEFQEISKLKFGSAIEGAIRHFAQSSQYLMFIFSGSNRHMLIDLFGNQSRPLYSLCDWITLHKLPPKTYTAYLKRVSLKTREKQPDIKIFEKMIELTECHPAETYGFCAYLWSYCFNEHKTLTEKLVTNCWHDYILVRVKQTKLTLANASSGQLRILILIATGFNHTLSGKEAQLKLNLTSPSIVKALETLEGQDLIEKMEDNSYNIINPVTKATLIAYYADYLS